MSGRKILLILLLIVVLLGSVAAGVYWSAQHYVLVDLQFYPRDARQLDLRDEDITVKHYEKLLRRLPGCEILWNVPFQADSFPHDTEELTLVVLSEQDIRVLDCFTQLKKVHAEACGDYRNLLALQQRRPEVEVSYSVQLGARRYSCRETEITVSDLPEADISLLECLPKLRTVRCSGGEAGAVNALKAYCESNGLTFGLSFGGEAVTAETTEITAGTVTGDQLSLLQFLPKLKKLHIRQPELDPEKLLQLQKEYPNVKISWERELFGTTVLSDAGELDLSGVKITDLEELDREMRYFPDVKTVFLGECGLDNEALAKQRDLVRDRYQLVWTVSFGSKLKCRTDATTFMPVREYVYYFNDEEAYNLRYCEDMVCIDIGHMSIHNIDFVEYMPDLEFLILAHTQVQYIEPIKHCKKLKFLELDWSPIRDLTPLKECTALEDLNLGNTFADFAPVGEMTWLKNLWMIGCSTRARYEMTQALPDTKVMVTGEATVANGWRDLDNYYEMRDLLGMYYMSW